jgi:nucleoside phosphorylase
MGRARVGILTVIPEEFDAIREVFQIHANIPGSQYYVGALNQMSEWDVVATQCMDRSNIPATVDVAEFIDDFRPQILVLVGVAGGLCDQGIPRDGIALGDVVIANYVSYVDFVKITHEGVFVRHYALDHPSIALNRGVSLALKNRGPVVSHVHKPDGGDNLFRIHIGEVVSGEKIMGGLDDPLQTKLLAPFDKALVVDMESIGMARMVCDRRSSFWYHPRYAVIRGISDMVGVAGNNETRGQWKLFAATSAALVAKQFIDRLPHDRPLA